MSLPEQKYCPRCSNAFECKVGKGKLMVSGIDLLGENDKRPAARQLLYSLKKYMMSSAFEPAVEVDLDNIKSLMKL